MKKQSAKPLKSASNYALQSISWALACPTVTTPRSTRPRQKSRFPYSAPLTGVPSPRDPKIGLAAGAETFPNIAAELDWIAESFREAIPHRLRAAQIIVS